MKILHIMFVLLLASLAGCSHQGEIPDQRPADVDLEVEEYSIGVGDSLSINVWRNPELSLDVPVRPDGQISLPLVGDVQAAGVTASQLSQNLQTQLVNFIRNPQVTVIVTEAASADYQNRVRVTGAVEQPLSISHRNGMTVLDIVLEAGGTTEFAVQNKAVLYRNTGTGIESYRVRLGDILKKGALDTNYEIVPGDILIVPERVL